MPTDAQVLIGKVLQIKDKLYAKRHSIPTDLQNEWSALNKKTACFESEALFDMAVKGKQMNKKMAALPFASAAVVVPQKGS